MIVVVALVAMVGWMLGIGGFFIARQALAEVQALRVTMRDTTPAQTVPAPVPVPVMPSPAPVPPPPIASPPVQSRIDIEQIRNSPGLSAGLSHA